MINPKPTVPLNPPLIENRLRRHSTPVQLNSSYDVRPFGSIGIWTALRPPGALAAATAAKPAAICMTCDKRQ